MQLGGIFADAPDDARELGLDLRDVGRDLVDAAGEDIEVVVAVELELGEDVRSGVGGRPGEGGRKLGVPMLLLEVAHRL